MIYCKPESLHLEASPQFWPDRIKGIRRHQKHWQKHNLHCKYSHVSGVCCFSMVPSTSHVFGALCFQPQWMSLCFVKLFAGRCLSMWCTLQMCHQECQMPILDIQGGERWRADDWGGPGCAIKTMMELVGCCRKPHPQLAYVFLFVQSISSAPWLSSLLSLSSATSMLNFALHKHSY